MRLQAVTAALLLPRDEDGTPDWRAFEHNARFLMDAGVSGLCVNGATGEYPGATRDERRQAVVLARSVAGREGVVVSGIGGTRWDEIVAAARDAESGGADAVLVPVPHFFKYSPADLSEFYRRIAAEVKVPAVIYCLPDFTGAVDPELVLRLIQDVPNIIGVKDSSGGLKLLEDLTHGGNALRLVGHDGVLSEALERGLCDGAISGVAGVLPELTVALWNSAGGNHPRLFEQATDLLRTLIEQLAPFPTPWGLKLIAEVRGFGPASFSLPLSEDRRVQASQFGTWFSGWWKDAEVTLGQLPATTGTLK